MTSMHKSIMVTAVGFLVLVWSSPMTSAQSQITVSCEQANAIDSAANCNSPSTSGCCCWCPDPTGAHAWGHVMDLGTVVGDVDVSFQIRPGAGDASCVTTGYMYDSLDGVTWRLFWQQSDLHGWTTYSDTVHIPDTFRYIRANTDGCSVDLCTATVNASQPPTVVILQAFDTIYISDPISHSRSFPVSAEASPTGGSFKWEIIHHGEGQVQFASATTEGSLASSVEIQPIRTSVSYEDVEIKVTYTVGSQSDDDSIRIAVVEPRSLSVEWSTWPPYPYDPSDPHRWPPDPTDPSDPYRYGYQLFYFFQVRDHILGRPIQHIMNWDEKRHIVARESTPKWHDLRDDYGWSRLVSGGGPTDEDGIIRDWLASSKLPEYSCVTIEQNISVEGWPVGTRHQKYYDVWAESVEVSPK